MINSFKIDRYGNIERTTENLKDKKGKYLSSENEKGEKDLLETDHGQKNNAIARRSLFSDYININVGYSLVVPLLFGVVIGLSLDSRFATKPFYTVIFIFLGLISSLYNLFKLIK